MPQRPIVLTQTWKAAHLIWTGYGHWLPNDPRGSGSTDVRSEHLRDLGAIHHGRKRVQPPRHTLRTFYKEAEPRLLHPVLWFRAEHRQAIAQAISHAVRDHGYTLLALAILRNHAHAVVRTHREPSKEIWNTIATVTRAALHEAGLSPKDHPVWSQRPYVVPLRLREEIANRIRYVEANPEKEGLPRQQWDCVTPLNR
jgi:hypothetical protein